MSRHDRLLAELLAREQKPEIADLLPIVVDAHYKAHPPKDGTDGIKGDEGPVGPEGPRGPQGPKGETGDRGPAGEDGRSLNWRGAWTKSRTYAVDDVVSSDGSSYIARVPMQGSKPPSSGWDLVAAKGADGKAGGVVLTRGGGSSASAPAGDGAVPVGGIIMWSGTIATIPTPDWELCDGTANAPGPDLRDKFVVGASVDEAGAAKTNIEGSLKVSTTATGATLANHAALTHANGAVGDHTNLTHDGAVASHADLTHAALSHPAITVTHADHSVASQSHTHASGADVSVVSGSFASAANVSYPSHSHASAANASAPSGSFASTNAVSVPSSSAPSGADHTEPSRAAQAGVSGLNTITRSVVTTGGLVVTVWSGGVGGSVPSEVSQTGVSYPSHTHASAANASAPSGTIASTAGVSVPSATAPSGADASRPSGSIASSLGSRPSITGSDAAFTLTHADHSLASLSHQAIGTHTGLTHAFTPPAGHGAAGTLTHSVTQADNHAISAHGIVAIVPAYYAIAFIQRMA